MRWFMKISPPVWIGFVFVASGLYSLTLSTPELRIFCAIVSFAVALWAFVAWFVRRRAQRGATHPTA